MFDTGVLEDALRRHRERLERERVKLLGVVALCLKTMRKRYGIKEAYIIGSLLIPHRWSDRSDIDVAVSGCSENLLDIMKELEEATGREVDVLDLERHPSRESIVKKGMRIYG